MTACEAIDSKYPNLQIIYFYLTKECNLRCRHCWIAPKYQSSNCASEILDLQLFKHIIKEAQQIGLTGVKLTGGEPLLHPDIFKVLDIIHKEQLRLTVETNGTLCSFELAQKMAACKNAFVSVSIDGINAETHEWVRGVAGCYNMAIQGIKNLVRAGIKPQIIMSLMKRNHDQIEDMIELAESLGVESVKFNLVQPTSRGEEMHRNKETLSIEELIEIGNRVENTLSKTTDMRLVYHHPPAFRPLSRIFGQNGCGCGVCGIHKILGVLSDGSYSLCGIGESVQKLVFGNAKFDSLQEIWHNTPVLGQIREGLPQKLEGICGECIVKGMCLGSCIAQNYYTHKNLWASFWFCDKAMEKGLFPLTRKIDNFLKLKER